MTEPREWERQPVDIHDPRVVRCINRYWRKNVLIMIVLLIVWAAVGLGCGVIYADRLNEVKLGGFPLGFWFAQQGSIIVFVLLILTYALLLNRLDATHHRELQYLRGQSPPGPPPDSRPATSKPE